MPDIVGKPRAHCPPLVSDGGCKIELKIEPKMPKMEAQGTEARILTGSFSSLSRARKPLVLWFCG